MEKIINFLLENWESISGVGVAVLALLARIWPTEKNWDVIGGIFKALDKAIPNLKKNKDDGSITRHCIVWLVFLVPIFGYSQNAIIGGGMYQYKGPAVATVQDTAFLQATRTNYQNLYGNTGLLYFDKARNKYRVWNGSAYVDLIRPAGATYTANNGITLTGTNFQWGGTLNQNTSVLGDNNNLFLGTSDTDGELFQFGVRANDIITLRSLSGGVNLQASANTFSLGSVTTTFAGSRVQFTPISSRAGLNVGSVAGGVTSGQSNGDIWYNSTSNLFQFRQNGATVGLGMTNPMTTGGDLIYGGASGTPTRLSNGTAGQILQSNGGTLAHTWVTPSGGTVTSVSITAGTNITQSGSPITGSGAITVNAVPSGSPNDVQINVGGNFFGSSNFTAVTDLVNIGGADGINLWTANANAPQIYANASGTFLIGNTTGTTAIQASGTNQNVAINATENVSISSDSNTVGTQITTTLNNAIIATITTDEGNSAMTVREESGVRRIDFTANMSMQKGISTTANDGSTINTTIGRFRKDTSGTTYTLTNSYILDGNTIIHLTPANAAIDATATDWTVSCTTGSATITFNLAPTSDFDMNFQVFN